jgi:predicted secreted protein
MRIYGSAVAAVLAAAIAFLFACAWGGTGYSADKHATLSANLNKPFTIVVESNPTTGYSWSAKFDASRLRLKSSSYERPAEPRPGAGGKQVFVLVPLKEGRTEVVLQYRRPWEKAPVKTRSYEILVSP